MEASPSLFAPSVLLQPDIRLLKEKTLTLINKSVIQKSLLELRWPDFRESIRRFARIKQKSPEGSRAEPSFHNIANSRFETIRENRLNVLKKNMGRKGLSPEFRATRLWRGIKKGPLWRFSAYFPVFKAKRAPEKSVRNPGYQ